MKGNRVNKITPEEEIEKDHKENMVSFLHWAARIFTQPSTWRSLKYEQKKELEVMLEKHERMNRTISDLCQVRSEEGNICLIAQKREDILFYRECLSRLNEWDTEVRNSWFN